MRHVEPHELTSDLDTSDMSHSTIFHRLATQEVQFEN